MNGSVEVTCTEVVGVVNAVIIITPDPPTGTAPLTVGLDASSSTASVSGATIVKYTWDFNDPPSLIEVHNETPPIPVTTHTYSSAGTYLVKLTVEDSLGNKRYDFKSIGVSYP